MFEYDYNKEFNMKKFRNQYRNDSVRGLLYSLLFFVVCLFTPSITNAESFGQFIFVLLLKSAFIVLAIWIFCNCIKNLYIYWNPSKSERIIHYGNIERIYNEIKFTIEYEDFRLIISNNYIISKTDCRQFFFFNDILGAYIEKHKTNGITDAYSIVVIDKYNFKGRFRYDHSEKSTVDYIMNALISKCKNSKFGYSNETLEYIKENIIK